MRGMRECADDAYDTTPGGKPRAKVYGAKGLRAIARDPSLSTQSENRDAPNRNHETPGGTFIEMYGTQ